MSAVAGRAGIREPRADLFETVISFESPLDPSFVGSFILAMEAFANAQDCRLLIDGISEGSIKFRWKIALGALVSANALSIAADASQVADFMHEAWKNAIEQTSEGKRTSLGKVICRAIEDGTIESITFRQPGGQTMRIDADSLKTTKPEIDVQWIDLGAGYGGGAVIMYNGTVANTALDNGEAFNLEQSYQGRIHLVGGDFYFQPNGAGPILPIADERIMVQPFIDGAEYITRGKYRFTRGVPVGFVLVEATLID